MSFYLSGLILIWIGVLSGFFLPSSQCLINFLLNSSEDHFPKTKQNLTKEHHIWLVKMPCQVTFLCITMLKTHRVIKQINNID